MTIARKNHVCEDKNIQMHFFRAGEILIEDIRKLTCLQCLASIENHIQGEILELEKCIRAEKCKLVEAPQNYNMGIKRKKTKYPQNWTTKRVRIEIKYILEKSVVAWKE